jgi:hypothetical protein
MHHGIVTTPPLGTLDVLPFPRPLSLRPVAPFHDFRWNLTCGSIQQTVSPDYIDINSGTCGGTMRKVIVDIFW